jgi:transposase InsO family protein
MNQFNKFKGTKGFISTWYSVLRSKDMINQRAQHKARVLEFWKKHGLEAACDLAQRTPSTIYRWRQKLNAAKSLEALNGDTVPKTKRSRREWDGRITDYIIKQRGEHYRYGKIPLYEELKELCKQWQIQCPSESTVGRIISDLKKQGKLKDAVKYSLNGKTGNLIEKKPQKKRKKQRRGSYQPKNPGDLWQLDTVVKYKAGIRRYVISAIDLVTRFTFSFGYKSLSSYSAKDFLQRLKIVCPYPIDHVQTDNGLEFEKEFRKSVEQSQIIHFHNYPKSPKMNAFIERYNRTVQEQFVDWNMDLLFTDIEEFNRQLMDWLIWYNTKRPHQSLSRQAPLKFYVSTFLSLTSRNSHMWWTSTITGQLRKKVV